MSATDPAPFRLVVVSNRGPYHLRLTKGGLKRQKAVGGLVSSILPMMERLGGVWLASGEPEGRYPNAPTNPSFELRYLQLTPEEIQGFYHGLANGALWPLCHYFTDEARYIQEQWEVYKQVNRRFAQATLEEARSGDVIWVQDYQLALVPCYLRRERPDARIAFFWHIPFPAPEVFLTFPWRRPLIESLLSCDLIGFHIPGYAENFIRTAVQLFGLEAAGSAIYYQGRAVQVLARPIGIDYDGIACGAQSKRTVRRAAELRASLQGQTIILGVERMDYTKGILERLRAFERLLERQPELSGKVTLIQIVTPSRDVVEAYRRIKREIDETVGRINGRFSDGIWVPIRYQYRTFSPSELLVYYRAADVALVTPLRDGLNLIAKEYVAARVEADGVLILSEFAGVAQQLREALIVNPYNLEELADALAQALAMPKPEQQERMEAMQARIKQQDINWWANEFLQRLNQIH